MPVNENQHVFEINLCYTITGKHQPFADNLSLGPEVRGVPEIASYGTRAFARH